MHAVLVRLINRGRGSMRASDPSTAVLVVGGHYRGKGGTVAPERNNGQQRHWTAALRRRSIAVSRSLAMPLAHSKDALPARQRRLAAVKGIE